MLCCGTGVDPKTRVLLSITAIPPDEAGLFSYSKLASIAGFHHHLPRVRLLTAFEKMANGH